MDYLSGERVDCYLPGVSGLPHYDYIDLVFAARKVPRRVRNPNRSADRPRPYIRAFTHARLIYASYRRNL